MKKARCSNSGGFSLVELMIVMLLAAILLTFGVPALQKVLMRSGFEAMISQVEATFRQARFDAIKEGQPVVVQLVPDDEGRTYFRLYTDVPVLDGNGARTDTPFVFQPVNGAPAGTTDRELRTVTLPDTVSFRAPGGEQIVSGLTNISGGDASDANIDQLVAVFEADGSVQDIGAIRVGDRRGNYFEFAIDVAATGKLRLAKWDCARTEWFERYYLNESTSETESITRWQWYSNRPGGC